MSKSKIIYKNNLRTEAQHIASGQKIITDAPLDMYLMSLCEHFIISNSSMYWWAAYLGETNSSLVITPSVGLTYKDSIPPHWIKIE